MAKSLKEVATAIMEANENASTLKPDSKLKEPPKKLPGEEEDLGGATPTEVADENLGKKGSDGRSRDTSKSSKSAVAAEPMKKLSEEDDEMNETVLELDEEDEKLLEDFVAEMIEEGLSEEEIEEELNSLFESMNEEDEDEDKDDMKEEKITEIEIPEIEIDMTEHVNALFNGESLSEDFKNKAITIFNSATKAKVDEYVSKINEQVEKVIVDRVDELAEALEQDVQLHLDYIVEQWISENEIAINNSVKTELAEDLLAGLKTLFEEHYIDIPDEKVAVLDELAEKVEELESKLNEEIEKNVQLNKIYVEERKTNIVSEQFKELSDAQREKLLPLVENVEFANEEDLVEQITLLKENYFPSNVKVSKELENVVVDENGQSMLSEDGPMAAYVRTLGRTKRQ